MNLVAVILKHGNGVRERKRERPNEKIIDIFISLKYRNLFKIRR